MACVRKSVVDHEDAQAIFDYFSVQHGMHSGFKFSIQLDEDGRLLNFFWVDIRSVKAYELFGDVVTFDTSYKANKYKMSFAPFFGIDNHMNTIYFGCALLQDETEETFVWLFKAWLAAMNGNYPVAVILDQNIAIMNAAKNVFPRSRYRLCLWHITQKFSKRLAKIYHDNSKFKSLLDHCIYDTLNVEDFERDWKELIEKYGLMDIEWLQILYMMRQFWVPVYLKDTFFGCMNTTEMSSKSMNDYFNGCVHSGTTLIEFVVKYNKALEDRYEKMRMTEFSTRHKVPIMTLGMDLEQHAGEVYTTEIFKLFHAELTSMLSLTHELLIEADNMRLYWLFSRLDRKKTVSVEYDICNNIASCQCKLFQFKGILCRHILHMFFVNAVVRIPPQYIRNRWTKDADVSLLRKESIKGSSISASSSSFQLKLKFEELCKIVDDKKHLLPMAVSGIENLIITLNNAVDEDDENEFHATNSHSSAQTEKSSVRSILDPKPVVTKGRKKLKKHKNVSNV